MALLRASVQNPYFWYSTLVTVAMALFLLAYAKSRSDFHKYTWVSAGWLADFYNETQLARNEMDRAIEKHNRHIEKCNRAIEAEADGKLDAAAERGAGAVAGEVRTTCPIG